MNRQSCIALVAVAGLVLGGVVGTAHAGGDTDRLISEVNESIALAEVAVKGVRSKIETGKKQLALIPKDSELYNEVTQVIASASEKWTAAKVALDGAKKSAARIASAKSSDLAQDFALLAMVHAEVALSGAKVLETGLLFVDAAASNKAEAIGIIRKAMKGSLDAATQVQSSCDRVMKLIAEKHSAS